jgi:hypothetical protein
LSVIACPVARLIILPATAGAKYFNSPVDDGGNFFESKQGETPQLGIGGLLDQCNINNMHLRPYSSI